MNTTSNNINGSGRGPVVSGGSRGGNDGDRRRRRLAWACGGVALLDLIALLLLIFLPYDCTGLWCHGIRYHDGELIARVDTVERSVRDTVVVVVRDTVAAEGDEIDDAVEAAGGNTSGFMRFSITWNQSRRDIVDLDAHAVEPTRAEICYSSYRAPMKTRAGGQLDVDQIDPPGMGVENIYWDSAEMLPDGNYRFFIVNFDGGQNRRCDAKLKVGEQTFMYRVSNIRKGAPANIATVTIKNHRMESIQHSGYLVQQ